MTFLQHICHPIPNTSYLSSRIEDAACYLLIYVLPSVAIRRHWANPSRQLGSVDSGARRWLYIVLMLPNTACGYRYRALTAPGSASAAKGAVPMAGSPEEAASYSQFLRIMLEIVNCLVASNLTANPELVYALLHRQEELQPLLVGSGK